MTASTLTDTNAVTCPTCGGQMYDNRVGKTNPKAPDFKCKNRACKGVIWPPKGKPADITPINSQQPEPVKKPTMRETYASLTRWVISDVVPIYDQADIGIPPEAIAACVQTLFIQACQAGKVE